MQNKQYYEIDTQLIAKSIDKSVSSVQKKAKKEQWPHTRQKIKGANAYSFNLWDLPEEIRIQVIDHLQWEGVPASKILGVPEPEPEPLEDDVDLSWLPQKPKPVQVSHETVEELEEKMLRSTSKAARDKAFKRAQACMDVLSLRRQGYGKEESIRMVSGPGQSRRALCDWLKKVDGQPVQYFAALLFQDYPTEKKIKKPFSLAARRHLCILYFRPEKPSKAACYRELEKLAKINGWQIPGQKMAERYLSKVKNDGKWVYGRDGEESLERKCGHLKRNKDSLRALSIVVADGHTLDLKVMLPSGKEGRPVLIAWMDVKSNKILSYRMVESENQHDIRESFCDILKNYGIPEHTYLDNGRAFANKAMSGGIPHRYRFKVQEDDFKGLFFLVGSDVTWARPHHGQSKTIERAWGTLVGDIAKHPNAAGAYTGRSPENKPSNYGQRVLDWEEAKQIVEQGILSYNALEGRTGDGMNGRSFNEVFAESYESSPIRKATKSQIDAWYLMTKKVKVSKDGCVAIGDRKYWPKEHLGLGPYEGKEIVVGYDRHNPLAEVRFETLDRMFIGMGETFEAEFLDPEGAERIENRRRSIIKQAKKEYKEALKSLDGEEIKSTPKLKAPPVPQAGVIVPHFKRGNPNARVQEQETESESGYTGMQRSMLTIIAKEAANKKAL